MSLCWRVCRPVLAPGPPTLKDVSARHAAPHLQAPCLLEGLDLSARRKAGVLVSSWAPEPPTRSAIPLLAPTWAVSYTHLRAHETGAYL
eukprot:6209080-Pyramimonas_sp.AAC.1